METKEMILTVVGLVVFMLLFSSSSRRKGGGEIPHPIPNGVKPYRKRITIMIITITRFRGMMREDIIKIVQENVLILEDGRGNWIKEVDINLQEIEITNIEEYRKLRIVNIEDVLQRNTKRDPASEETNFFNQ